jgi:hypothetical protein
VTIEVSLLDVQLFAPAMSLEEAAILVDGTIARAAVYVPGILAEDFPNVAAAQDIIRVGVLRRWRNDGGQVTTETIGPYSTTVDTRSSADGLFSDSEMLELQRMCLTEGTTTAVLPQFSFPTRIRAWPDPVERPL